jgi:hypothetical protein
MIPLHTCGMIQGFSGPRCEACYEAGRASRDAEVEELRTKFAEDLESFLSGGIAENRRRRKEPDVTLLSNPDDRFPWEDENGLDQNGPLWSDPPDLCRACGGMILPENRGIADGCPCNSARGVNHGLVPKNTCTCVECDPNQTGSTRIGSRT